jgi:general secretion pathway protein G
VLLSPEPSAMSRATQRRAGMTLLELLVVLAAIAILAAVVGPSLFRNVGDAKMSSAKSQLEIFATSLGAFRLDNDGYPTTGEGLDALRTAPPAGRRTWRGPYLTKVVPLDPWGRPYTYISPGIQNPESFDLYSLGRNGVIGGIGEDADFTSWGGPVSAP